MKDFTELKQLANDTLKLMNIAFCDLSYRRKFLIQPHLQREYSDLCSDNVPIIKFLFGDELSKTITDTEATNKIAKTVSKNKGNFVKKRDDLKAPKTNVLANYGYVPPHPYNNRFAFLARTPQRTFPPMSTSMPKSQLQDKQQIIKVLLF